jgi:hypothetical protein
MLRCEAGTGKCLEPGEAEKGEDGGMKPAALTRSFGVVSERNQPTPPSYRTEQTDQAVKPAVSGRVTDELATTPLGNRCFQSRLTGHSRLLEGRVGVRRVSLRFSRPANPIGEAVGPVPRRPDVENVRMRRRHRVWSRGKLTSLPEPFLLHQQGLAHCRCGLSSLAKSAGTPARSFRLPSRGFSRRHDQRP